MDASTKRGWKWANRGLPRSTAAGCNICEGKHHPQSREELEAHDSCWNTGYSVYSLLGVVPERSYWLDLYDHCSGDLG